MQEETVEHKETMCDYSPKTQERSLSLTYRELDFPLAEFWMESLTFLSMKREEPTKL